MDEVIAVSTAKDQTAVVVGYFSTHPSCGNCLVGCASKTGSEALACAMACATPPKPERPTRAPAEPVYVTAQTEYGPVRGQEVRRGLCALGSGSSTYVVGRRVSGRVRFSSQEMWATANARMAGAGRSRKSPVRITH